MMEATLLWRPCVLYMQLSCAHLKPNEVLDALALGTGSSIMAPAHLVCILNPMLVLNALAPETEAV